jgi:hypothetical protein
MSDGFTKRYELHYQPKKMKIDMAVLDAQFGRLNFHVKRVQGHWGEAYCRCEEQMSCGLDESLVLLQGSSPSMPSRGEKRTHLGF